MNPVCTILIVDDENDLLEMYKDFFEMENFKVFTASNGSAGLEILKVHSEIEVIISDSHMPGMTGLQFLGKVRELTKIPKFYLATGDLNQNQDEIVKLEGTGMILKPFDVEVVIAKILEELNGKP